MVNFAPNTTYSICLIFYWEFSFSEAYICIEFGFWWSVAYGVAFIGLFVLLGIISESGEYSSPKRQPVSQRRRPTAAPSRRNLHADNAKALAALSAWRAHKRRENSNKSTNFTPSCHDYTPGDVWYTAPDNDGYDLDGKYIDDPDSWAESADSERGY